MQSNQISRAGLYNPTYETWSLNKGKHKENNISDKYLVTVAIKKTDILPYIVVTHQKNLSK